MSLTGALGDVREEGMLGHVFLSIDELQEIKQGNGDRMRPTYISKKLSPKFIEKLTKLFKELDDNPSCWCGKSNT
jgi:hypothetical protein